MSVYYKDNPVHFDRALHSITVNQTIIPNEIVLVCDGPINKELENIIAKYSNMYSIFNIIRLEKNVGLGNALKIAVQNASNELIARMDSDDVSVYDRFSKQLNFLKVHPDVDIVGGIISEFIDSEDNIIGKRIVPLKDGDIKTYMKTRCAMNHVTVMYKKQAVINAGNYIDWYWNEDYYLWIRMLLKKATFANIGEVLVNVRVGKDMYQRRGGKAYFKSEINIQKLMLKKGIINYHTYISNILKRMIVQVLLPNSVRGWVFRKFARNH